MSSEYIKQVKKKYEKAWMHLPEVQAVGIGITSTGKQGIIVIVKRLNDALKKQLPTEVEGIPVEVQLGGPFLAR